MNLILKSKNLNWNIKNYHSIVGLGSATSLHSKVTFLKLSAPLIMGFSVNKGLVPSAGMPSSSPAKESKRNKNALNKINCMHNQIRCNKLITSTERLGTVKIFSLSKKNKKLLKHKKLIRLFI